MAAGAFAWVQGDLAVGIQLSEQSIALAREARDPWALAAALDVLGVACGQAGDLESGRRHLEECIAVYRGLDDGWGTGLGCMDLSKVVRLAGRPDESRALLEEGVHLMRASGDIWQLSEGLAALGGMVLEAGDATRAAALAAEGLSMLRAHGQLYYVAEYLELSGEVASAQGEPTRAVQLFGAAEATRLTTGYARPRESQPLYERHLAAIRATLDSADYASAWAAGRALTPGQAVDDALAALERSQAAPGVATNRADAQVALLTPRECEVAALVAQGLTNRQIAETLVISDRTADNHVSHILDKLGLSSRAQVAAWAVSHGLASAVP
jgi:DNA-binding CsgD family transcriptional regulator